MDSGTRSPRFPSGKGIPIEINGKANDSAGQNDTLTYHWSVFKGNSQQPLATDSGVDKQNFLFTPEDGGRYRILLVVSHKDGGSDSTEQSIDVANVAPSATIVSVSPQCREGAPGQVEAKASEPTGSHETITYYWQASRVGSTEVLAQKKIARRCPASLSPRKTTASAASL